jgi:hypothetical protein
MCAYRIKDLKKGEEVHVRVKPSKAMTVRSGTHLAKLLPVPPVENAQGGSQAKDSAWENESEYQQKWPLSEGDAHCHGCG